MTSTPSLILTLTSSLEHDPDFDHDHDQLMHTIEARWARGYGRGLAKSVAHGKAKPPTPAAGLSHLTRRHSAGGSSQGGLPVHASWQTWPLSYPGA